MGNHLQFIFLFLLFNVMFLNLSAQSKTLQIKNNENYIVNDYIVEIPVSELNLPIGNYALKYQDKLISPIEIVSDIFANQYAVFCLPQLSALKNTIYNIEQTNFIDYPKRTYAELTHKIGGKFIGKEYIGGYSWVKVSQITLPGTFRDHSYYLKYEGPGWENDKIAFRFYLDNRNAMDVFGKVTSNLVLSAVGVDNFDSYHKLANWGMDNTRVGASLGLGSIAYWDGKKAERIAKRDSTTCIIETDGRLRSQIRTIYHAWPVEGQKVDLTSFISIDAGRRVSHVELMTDKPISNLTTGIIKINEGKLVKQEEDTNAEWTYIATFGKQSMIKDIQGLAVFFRREQVKEITEDDLNHIVVLQPDSKNYVQYYIMSTWELDTEPVKTESEFLDCINQELQRLNGKIEYKVIK